MVKNVKNIFLNVFLIVLTVLLFLAILEIILSYTFIKVDKYNNELFKERILEGDTPYKPNAYVIFEGTGHNKLEPTVVKINSQGLRDYEYSVEKPNNTFRILGFGDSFTWGHGVELDETYLKQLERKLNSVNSKVHYEVLNFGVGGYNTQRSVNLLKTEGLAYKPDMVIVLCSINDIKLPKPIKFDKKNSLLDRLYISEWVKGKIENFKIRKDVSKIESNPNELWQLIEPSMIELSQMAKENNFTVVLLLLSLHHFPDVYEKSALENGFFIAHFHGKKNIEGLPVFLKDLHPSPLGHKLIAEELYETLMSNNFIPLGKK